MGLIGLLDIAGSQLLSLTGYLITASPSPGVLLVTLIPIRVKEVGYAGDLPIWLSF